MRIAFLTITTTALFAVFTQSAMASSLATGDDGGLPPVLVFGVVLGLAAFAGIVIVLRRSSDSSKLGNDEDADEPDGADLGGSMRDETAEGTDEG